jgi:archaellum component FlaC
MSDIDEVLSEVEGLESKIERMEKTYIEVTGDLIKAVQIQTATIERMGEVIALAKSPSQKDLEDFAALREAFDKYDFKRKLILGED